MIDQLIQECAVLLSTERPPEMVKALTRLRTLCVEVQAGTLPKMAASKEALHLAYTVEEMTRVLSGRELDDAVRKTFGQKTLGEVFA